MQNPPLIIKSLIGRELGQLEQAGYRLRFKFYHNIPAPTSQLEDCFSKWLREGDSVNIDWSNFGVGPDA